MEFEKQTQDILEQTENENTVESSEKNLTDHDNQAEDSMCMTELSVWKDQCKRISAEFENFKRRCDRDQARSSEMTKESIFIELLPFIDTFELALAQKENIGNTGINMAYQSLLKLLAKYDVIAISSNAQFDPELHEAVMQVESDQHQSGDIVETLSKGFTMKNRVIRHSKVSVAV